AGHLGKIHIRLLLELQNGSEVVALFDPSAQSAAQVKEPFGITRYEDAEELLNLVDAVDIVTPTVTHFQIAANAIRRSKHIFIEKPLTETSEEAQQLTRLADEAGVKVQVGHVERFNPAFQAALPY